MVNTGIEIFVESNKVSSANDFPNTARRVYSLCCPFTGLNFLASAVEGMNNERIDKHASLSFSQRRFALFANDFFTINPSICDAQQVENMQSFTNRGYFGKRRFTKEKQQQDNWLSICVLMGDKFVGHSLPITMNINCPLRKKTVMVIKLRAGKGDTKFGTVYCVDRCVFKMSKVIKVTA